MKKTGHYISACALKLLAFGLSLLPWDLSVRMGALLGRLASKIIYKRFPLTVDNIRRALPGVGEAEARTIAVKSFENMGVVAAEFAQAAHCGKEELLSHCRIINPEKLQAHLATGKGALCHIGHIANWELVGLAFNAAGYRCSMVARHIRNPYVDDYIMGLRTRFGGDIIGHRAPFFGCVRALKRGRMVGILMDQNMPAGEVFTPFLGRMASTTPLTALLSLKTGCPVFPICVRRVKGGIEAFVEDPIYPAPAYSEEEVYRLVEKLNSRLEEWIKADPPQWLWAHNRWKREKDALAAMEKNGKEAVAGK